METTSFDSLQLPSEIFGSPSGGEENAFIQPEEDIDVEIISEDGNNKIPSSNEESSSEDHLDQALKHMHRALKHSQNVKKRKFFTETIAGE